MTVEPTTGQLFVSDVDLSGYPDSRILRFKASANGNVPPLAATALLGFDKPYGIYEGGT